MKKGIIVRKHKAQRADIWLLLVIMVSAAVAVCWLWTDAYVVYLYTLHEHIGLSFSDGKRIRFPTEDETVGAARRNPIASFHTRLELVVGGGKRSDGLFIRRQATLFGFQRRCLPVDYVNIRR